MFVDHGDGFFDVHLFGVILDFRAVHAAGDDVEKGENASAGMGDDEAAEVLERIGSGTAGIDGGGDAVREGVVVGVEVEPGSFGVEVGVDIDEAGGDVIAGDIDDGARFFRGKVLADAGDGVSNDGDVEALIAMVGGVDDMSVLEEDVIDLGMSRESGEEEEEASHGITS